MDRLRTFADGLWPIRERELKVRHASSAQNPLGFAVPSQFCSPSPPTPEFVPGDVLEALFHELVHLHVGRVAEPHAWHSKGFKRTIAPAMQEGLRDCRA